ncbi:MAG: leucine-rich repeat domain-containing protein [Anaerolineae bacterium]|nr:leucine-rich repeat domain-containing protein [Anaerolineae bacterium]
MTNDELLLLIDKAVQEGWTELNLKSARIRVLPREVRRLTNLRGLDLSDNYLSELPPELWQLTNLSSLDLSENSLGALPAEISELSKLTSLDLSFNQSCELPHEIWQLSNLVSLDLSFCRLSELAPTIRNLDKLRTFTVIGVQIRELPSEIWQLTDLDYLDLRSNQLTELSRGIGHLTSLQTLRLWNNQLSRLPREIGRLTKLRLLDLGDNDIWQLPQQIGELTSLEELILSRNQLVSLPDEIHQLISIKRLHLDQNIICELPQGIGHFVALEELGLSGNRLTDLLPEIQQLTRLKSLDLSDNNLTKLPQEIEQLSSLEELSLSGNQLTDLPREIGRLTRLRSLDLSGNNLRALPQAIGRLANLERLVLSHNRLYELPDTIGQLTKLIEFDLRANELSELPSQFGKLENIHTLDLSENSLIELSPEIGNLISIQSVNFRNNQLSNIPREIEQWGSVITLNLDKNRLTELPAEIGRLSSLRSLGLGSNQLSQLPPQFGHLINVWSLNLDYNPWVEPYNELTTGPRTELFSYLMSLLRGVPQYEAKVLLVGEGAVGKTSLLRALRGDLFVEGLSTTHGIELAEIAVQHPDRTITNSLTLNFWDFGGQEVYRITHQFFFSRHALYLLVWKPREGREENALEEWLERIHLRAGSDARVIVVATHSKERLPELDYPALTDKYGDILAGHLSVDSSDGTGIDELKQRIAATVAGMPHVGTPFNKRWLDARDELRGLDRTHITRDKFIRICAGHGLSQTDASTLIGILHVLGQIIHYDSDGLRDFVVLKPEWLTKAIGYVLEDEPTRSDGGILDHRRLADIWYEHGDPNRETYPPNYFPYFLRLMEQFDVSARIEGQDASLVPQLVPFERPDIMWQAAGGELGLVCEMEQNPPGVIAWTTARNHRWSTHTHWRGGVFLRHEDGHEALVDFTSRLKRRLTLTVRGEYPAHFMSLLRDGLEQLIKERWPYLHYEMNVPCPTVNNGKTCDGRFPLETLHRARAKGIRDLRCQVCLEEIDVGRLLEGYVTPVEPLSQQLAMLESKLLAELTKASVERRHLQGILAESAEMTRRVMRALLDEARNGPRLFTLSPIDPRRQLDPRTLWSEELRLTLWCEHPGHEHELIPEGQYIMRNPRQWAIKLSPYAQLSLKVLRIAAPISVGAVGLAEQGIKDQWEDRFKFMEELSKGAAVLKPDLDKLSSRINDRQYPIARAEGEGLRAFHDLLAEVGWKEGAANLRKVSDKKTGDILWVCPAHYKEYDPGLPVLPEQL